MQPDHPTRSEPRTYEIPEDPLSAKPKRVLVLEDDVEFAATLKETLEDQDYRVTVVPNGAAGLQRILATDFDAILCDMLMPNFPGDMFYTAVQRSRPYLCGRFIFMTGHSEEPKIAKFLSEVKSPVLAKPFEIRNLFDALETVTGRSH